MYLVGLHFQKTHIVLFDGIAQQRSWQFLGFDEDFSRILFLLGHINAQFFQCLLIDGTHVTEPLPVGIHSNSFCRSLMNLIQFRSLHLVHLESLDSGFGSEGVVLAVGVSLDGTLGVHGGIGMASSLILILGGFVGLVE